MIRAPKGRANKAQASGLGCEPDPIRLRDQALQERNQRALTSSDRRLRRLERLVTPLQGWRIARHRFFTQAVGLGFLRPPLWGLSMRRGTLAGHGTGPRIARLTSRITGTGD